MLGEEAMNFPVGNEFQLYTGGCEGVDYTAEDFALQMGFKVNIIVGPLHPRARTITPLTYEELREADPHLQKANETLKRNFSTKSKAPYFKQLLQRNYHIIKNVTHVFAFGELAPDMKTMKGGTGWSVQLALDNHKVVTVYDVNSKKWYEAALYRWDEKMQWVKDFCFVPLGSIGWSPLNRHVPPRQNYPVLHKSSAIVGSRIISHETREEIRNLFQRTFTQEKEVTALCGQLNHFTF